MLPLSATELISQAYSGLTHECHCTSEYAIVPDVFAITNTSAAIYARRFGQRYVYVVSCGINVVKIVHILVLHSVLQ